MKSRVSDGVQRDFQCWFNGLNVRPKDETIREEMMFIGEVQVIQGDVQPQPVYERARRRIPEPDDLDLFDEIHQHYLTQQQQNQIQLINFFVLDEIIDAELTLYWEEPTIPLKDNEVIVIGIPCAGGMYLKDNSSIFLLWHQ
jgi:hypothetical protein